jgi:glycosyltransferase involved in cell wall biosynthesis
MKNNSPTVSVIIPTYNYGRFLSDCINSVLRQTYRNTEIIIVDDGSSDNTADVVKKFKNTIKYLYQDNKGLSAARNTGLRVASGEYIQFLDSDDLLGRDAIEKKTMFLQINEGLDIAVCCNRLYSSLKTDGTPKTCGRWFLPRGNLSTHLMYSNIAPPHAFLLRRDVVEQVGFFDESLRACEDYDYWLRCAKLGYIPHYCDQGRVFYRRHPSSMSANRFNQYYHDALLHFRVFSYFLSASENVSVPNWLAFWAGVLTTLARLELQKDPILEDLCSLFLKSVDIAASSKTINPTSLDSLSLAYWIIAQQKLVELRKLNNPNLASLVDGSYCLRYSSVFRRLTPKELANIISGWWNDPIDLVTLARSLIRYVRNGKVIIYSS